MHCTQISASMWRYGVVPVPMEGMTRELDGGEFLIRYFHALGIFAFIQFGAHSKSGCGAGRRDQLDDGPEAAQGLSAPIEGDKGKQTMFDRIPLAGPGRQVAYRDRDAQLIGQSLQFDLP